MFLQIRSDLAGNWHLSGTRTDKVPLGLHVQAKLGTIWCMGGFWPRYLSNFAKTWSLGFRLFEIKANFFLKEGTGFIEDLTFVDRDKDKQHNVNLESSKVCFRIESTLGKSNR